MHPRATPEPLGSSPRPQEPGSVRPKVEGLPHLRPAGVDKVPEDFEAEKLAKTVRKGESLAGQGPGFTRNAPWQRQNFRGNA